MQPSFIDLDDVHFADLKADDLGSWKAGGTKRTLFRVLPSGAITIIPAKPKAHSEYYLLTRRYFTHNTYHLFRRIIVDIRGRLLCIKLVDCCCGSDSPEIQKHF